MMKLDAQLKHGVLIGWLHLIAFIIFAIYPILRIIKHVNGEEYDELSEMPYEYIFQAFLFLFMATLSGLLIYGVVKKRHLFMAPWLVCFTIAVICVVGSLVVQCFTRFDIMIFILGHEFYMIAMQILVLYPAYNLYFNIREHSKKVVYSKNIEYSNKLEQNLYDSLDNSEEVKKNNDILIQKLQV